MHSETKSWRLFLEMQSLVEELIAEGISIDDFLSFYQANLSGIASIPALAFLEVDNVLINLKKESKSSSPQYKKILNLKSLDQYSKTFLEICKFDSSSQIPNIPRRIEHMLATEYVLSHSQKHHPDLYRKYQSVKLVDSGLSFVGLYEKYVNNYLNCFPDLKHFYRADFPEGQAYETQRMISGLAKISSCSHFMRSCKTVQDFEDKDFADFLSNAFVGIDKYYDEFTDRHKRGEVDSSDKSKEILKSIFVDSLSKILEEIKNLGLQDLDEIVLGNVDQLPTQDGQIVDSPTQFPEVIAAVNLGGVAEASPPATEIILETLAESLAEASTEVLTEAPAIFVGIDERRIRDQRDRKQYGYVKKLLQNCPLDDFLEEDQQWINRFIDKIKQQQSPQYQENSADIFQKLGLEKIDRADFSVYAPKLMCEGGVEFKRFKKGDSSDLKVGDLTIQYGELKTHNTRQSAAILCIDGKGILLPTGEEHSVGRVKTGDKTDQSFIDESYKAAQDFVQKIIKSDQVKYVNMEGFLEDNSHVIGIMVEQAKGVGSVYQL